MERKTNSTLEQIFQNLADKFNLVVEPLKIEPHHEKDTQGLVAQGQTYRLVYAENQNERTLKHTDVAATVCFMNSEGNKSLNYHFKASYIPCRLELLKKSKVEISKLILSVSENAKKAHENLEIEGYFSRSKINSFSEAQEFLNEHIRQFLDY